MRQELKQAQNAESKLLRFRTQIRKNSIKSRIQQQRKNLIDDIDFEDLKSILRNLDTLGFPKNEDQDKQNLNTNQLIQMLEILQQHYQEASFNMQAETENLGIGFSNIFLLYSKNIDIRDKQKLVSAISFLTYFSDESSRNLTDKQTFIEFLRTEIVELEMKEPVDIKYCKALVILLMNMASQVKYDFNLYLAQSDMCKSINQQIYKTINIEKHKNDEYYSQLVSQLRKCALRLFKNVISNLQTKNIELVVKLVSTVVRDEIYFVQHPDWMFLLLEQAMWIDQFWIVIMTSNVSELLLQHICYVAQTLQSRCQKSQFLKNDKETLTQRQQQLFHAMLLFLNRLNLEVDDANGNVLLNWEQFVQNLLNGFMLAEFIKIAHNNRKKKQIRTALLTYRHLSYAQFVTSQQLLIVKPIQQNYVLLKIFLDPSWTASSEVGEYCWQILRNLLAKDKQYHKKVMELLVIQRMQHVLDNKSSKPSLLIQLILFARQLILAFEDVSKIIQILQNKNIINKIQSLTSQSDRQVFEKAEMFIQLVAQKKQQKSI